jgi:DNA processing protein
VRSVGKGNFSFSENVNRWRRQYFKMSDTKYWVALSLVSELGARRIRLLYDHFASAKAAFTAAKSDLSCSGLPARAVAVLLAEREKIDPDVEWTNLLEHGYSVTTLADQHYPGLLRQIYDPPALLFYRGDLSVLDAPCVAIVGSRKATAYGRTAAARLAADLAHAGVVVISGMARGIDTCAHQGALESGGKSAAVLGCGLDICYPPENLRLREKIVRTGVLLSEFPPRTEPKAQHFPLRNRIISGLSLATIVVEAAEKSGALITADCALEQGREVFAVPGSINSPYSRGCHKLLKEGAAILGEANDVLLELGLAPPGQGRESQQKFSDEEQKVLSSLAFEPLHFDELLVSSGMTAPALAAILVELELRRQLRKLPGNYYLRV